MSGECEHHKYVVKSQEKTNERLEKLEAQAAINATMIAAICDKMDGLIKSIDALVTSNEVKMRSIEDRLDSVEQAESSKDVQLQYVEANVKEVRAWVIGAAGGILLAALGWLIWYLQNHYTTKSTIKAAWVLLQGIWT